MIDPATIQIGAVMVCSFVALVIAFVAMHFGRGW